MYFKIFPTLRTTRFTLADYNNLTLGTFGGFLEIRTGRDTGRHLGIDICVDPGTLVTVPCQCTLIDQYSDQTINNGWGGRLIFKLSGAPLYLIYGHLEHSETLQIGRVFREGEIIGQTSSDSPSGTWFPHLHVQIITDELYLFYRDDLSELDGYCHDLDEDLSKLVVDPISLIT